MWKNYSPQRATLLHISGTILVDSTTTVTSAEKDLPAVVTTRTTRTSTRALDITVKYVRSHLHAGEITSVICLSIQGITSLSVSRVEKDLM